MRCATPKYLLTLAFVVFGSAIMGSFATAQEYDFNDSWYSYPYSATTPPADPGATAPVSPSTTTSSDPVAAPAPSTASSAVPSGDTGNVDHTGYYKIGSDLYYYDQKTGAMQVTVRGKPDPDSSGAAADFSAGSSFSSSASRGPSTPTKQLLSPASSANSCSHWINPLRREASFSNSSECQVDLEDSVEAALSKLDSEQERIDQVSPSAKAMPANIRKVTEVTRPRLQSVLASLSKRGCNCDKQKF